MKKLIAAMACAGALGFLASGCATSFPTGCIYTNLSLPVSVGQGGKATKVGTAESRSYLGMVALGDSSIAEAMRNGGIKTVYYVDWQVENILGIFGTYRVVVYGE